MDPGPGCFLTLSEILKSFVFTTAEWFKPWCSRLHLQPTVDLVPVSVAELELVVRLEEGGDGTPAVVHRELDGPVHHLTHAEI